MYRDIKQHRREADAQLGEMNEFWDNHDATKDREILSGKGNYTYEERQHHVRLRSWAVHLKHPHIDPFFRDLGADVFIGWKKGLRMGP